MSEPQEADRPKPAFQARQTSQFKKDLKRLIRQGKDMALLEEVVDALVAGQRLDPKHKDHSLSNNRRGFRDCHIEPDWLLIYKKDDDILVLTLSRTGSHSELEL
jgi:mRNA interferase YafQ